MRVIIAGGGTGGHVNPGILIAKKILENEPDAVIKFIGTEKGLEKELVPRAGFKIEFIRAKGIKRKLSFENLKVLGEIGLGFFECIQIIKEFNPDIIVATGGYASAPVLLGAMFLDKPFVLHESNALPGITVKMLARFAKKIMVGFNEAIERFPNKKNVVYTGNPVASNNLYMDKKAIREKLKISNELPLVIITGGSQGAKAINKAVTDLIISHNGDINYTLYFATGKNNYDDVLNKLKEKNINIESNSNITILPYIYNMSELLPASDLLVGRAGAMTVSELCYNGVASILIPLPTSAENHQEYNARAIEKQEAGVVILEKDLNQNILSQKIEEIVFNKEKLMGMSKNAKTNQTKDAAEKIYEIIKQESLSNKGNNKRIIEK
jgi:UDP-N-acetylglucosamine--N-acetylmuramyl-(pentapeptide) pyrophosphoryl-undecaprenol N-acetylglucosamine transferase